MATRRVTSESTLLQNNPLAAYQAFLSLLPIQIPGALSFIRIPVELKLTASCIKGLFPVGMLHLTNKDIDKDTLRNWLKSARPDAIICHDAQIREWLTGCLKRDNRTNAHVTIR